MADVTLIDIRWYIKILAANTIWPVGDDIVTEILFRLLPVKLESSVA